MSDRVGLVRGTILPRGALLALVLVGAAARWAAAELPATRLLAIFPAGARQGTQVELTLTSGADLEGVAALQFTHPGITATPKMQAAEGQPPAPVPNQFLVTVAADVPVGFHEVRAQGTYGISNPRAFLVSDRPELNEVEPNNAPQQATEVPLGHWVNGRIDPAKDLDYFRFSAKAGQRVLCDVWAERLDSRLDATLELFDANGRQLDLNRDFQGHDAMLDFRVPADGEYLLKLYDFQFTGSPEHVYRLSIGQTPHIDVAVPAAIVPGQTANVVLWGRNLPGGVPAEGVSIGGQPLDRLEVAISMPADCHSAGKLEWQQPFEAAAAFFDGISYRLAGESGSSNPIFIAAALAPVVVEQEPNDTNPQLITVPAECAGQFGQRGDKDVYRFTAKKGSVYWIEVISQRLGLPTDPMFIVEQVIKNDQGEESYKELRSEDDHTATVGGQTFNTASGDPQFRFAVPEDGDYRLTVRDMYAQSHGDPRLAYRLSIREPRPDFRLAVDPEFPINGQQQPRQWTMLLRHGGSELLRVYALRLDGFEGEIALRAEGLPEGVTCAGATLGPGQTQAVLVLTAAEGAADWTGPIRVVGQAKVAEAELVREARPASLLWPPQSRPASYRVQRELAMTTAQTAPFAVAATPAQASLVQGQQLPIALAVTRRGEFKGVIAATAAALPAKVQNEAVNVAADQAQTELYLYFQPDAPTGTYTLYVQASTQVEFTKDPTGKDKKPTPVVAPSTPITVTIAPSPLVLAANVPGQGAIKQGQSLEIPVKLERRNGFAGAVTLDLLLPPGTAGIAAPPVMVAADQPQGTLVVQAAADAAEGARPHVAVRATVEIEGRKIEVHQPIPLVVQK